MLRSRTPGERGPVPVATPLATTTRDEIVRGYIQTSTVYETLPVVFATAGWVLVFMLFIQTSTTCMDHSIDRVFGDSMHTRGLVVIADGGDHKSAPGNTIDAYRSALQYTSWIRITVYMSAVANDTYFILSDDSFHYNYDGSENTHKCAASQYESALSAHRLALHDAVTFLVQHNATIVVSATHCSNSESYAFDESVAMVALHRHIMAAVPEWYASKLVYVYASPATVKLMHSIFGLTRSAFLYENSESAFLVSPFESEAGYETSASVDAILYDMWTCAQHVQVHQGSWINLYGIERYMKKAVVYSAARSVQTIDPKSTIEFITNSGFHVVSSL